MKLSFLIPTYKSEKILPKFIDSLKRQKNKSFEAIFVVEGLEDNTLSVLKKFKDSYPSKVKILINGKRQIRLQSIFTGLKECTGQYVAICSPKDVLSEKFVSKTISIVQNDNPEIIEFPIECGPLLKWKVNVKNKTNHLLNPQQDYSVLANMIPADFNKIIKRTLLEGMSHLEYFDGESRFGFSFAFNLMYICESYYATKTILKTTSVYEDSLTSPKSVIHAIKQSFDKIKMVGNLKELEAVHFLAWSTIAVFQMGILFKTRSKTKINNLYKTIVDFSKSDALKNIAVNNHYFDKNLIETKILKSVPPIRQYKKVLKGGV